MGKNTIREEIRNIKALKKQLELEKNTLKEEKEQLELEKIALKEEKEQLELEKIALKEEKEQLELEKIALKEEKEQLELEKNALKKDKGQIEFQKNSIEEEKEQVETQKNALKKEKEQIELQENSIRNEKKHIEFQKNSIQEEKEQVEIQKNALKNKIEQIELQENSIRNEKKQIEFQKNSIQEEKEQVEIQKNALKNKIEQIELQENSIRNEKKQIEFQKNSIQEEKEQVEIQKNALKNKIEQIELQENSIRNEKKQIEFQKNSIQEEKEQVEIQKNALKNKIEQIELQENSIRNEKKQIEFQKNSIQEEKEQVEIQKNALKNKIEQIELQENSIRNEKKQIEFQKNSIKNEKEQINNDDINLENSPIDSKGKLYVNYLLGIEESTEKYSILKIPKKGCIIRSHRFGKANRRGVKELEFQKHIELCFGNNFIVSGEVRLNTGKGSRPYEPDIAIIDKETIKNIRIDIEIDEPYDGSNRKPTHCIGKDWIRDNFFTDRGWIVLRFSEYQIHSQIYSCLKVIATLLYTINPKYKIQKNLKSVPELITEATWDEVQSEKWEKDNYREKYLNIEFDINDDDDDDIYIETELNETEEEEEREVITSSTLEDYFIDDRDGKKYKTIKIGNQVWLNENLSFKTQHGSWAYNNNEDNVEEYGRLYDWDSINSAIPEGWHLPSDEEWKELELNLGINTFEVNNSKWRGFKTKNKKTKSLDNPISISDLNLTSLFSGSFTSNIFTSLNESSFYWTSTEVDHLAWIRIFTRTMNKICRGKQDKIKGCSVRLVKDTKL